MILSDVFVDPWKPVPNDLLLEVPRVGRDADLSLNVYFRNVNSDWMFDADLGRFVLVDLYVSPALSKIGRDEVSNDEVRVCCVLEIFSDLVLDLWGVPEFHHGHLDMLHQSATAASNLDVGRVGIVAAD